MKDAPVATTKMKTLPLKSKISLTKSFLSSFENLLLEDIELIKRKNNGPFKSTFIKCTGSPQFYIY